MLDLISQLNGVKPAPIPDLMVRTHYLDRHPPNVIDDAEVFDDEAGGKTVPLKQRLIERQRIVHMLIAAAGEDGTYLSEIARELPHTSVSKIELAIKTLLQQGKIRAAQKRAGVPTYYWDATK